MTKEELEKEAEEWLCNNLHSASEEDFIKAMVDIAEPREKRIAELEKEKCELLGLIQGKDKDVPIKWHKVSEQIPTEEKSYLVKLTDETVDVMTIALDGNLEPYLLIPGFDFYKDVEKWCEIPEEE